MEELEAFDPQWRAHYSCVGAAAIAASVLELHREWLKTSDGQKYLETVKDLPDRVGQSKREAEAMSAPASLPYGYANYAYLPGSPLGNKVDIETEFSPRQEREPAELVPRSTL